MKKYLSLLLVLLMVSTIMCGCSSGDNSVAENTSDTKEETGETEKAVVETKESTYKELTVYTALPDDELPTYFNAFEADTGIKVNYVRLSAGEMFTRIAAEDKNPQASVALGGSIDSYDSNTEYLEAYQSSEVENVPAEYVDPNGIWDPIYVGALAFVCNKQWFEEKKLEYPTSWEDLLKPEFEGQISMSHPTASGTAYTILSSIIQLKGEEEGWDYISSLSKSVRQYTKSGSAPAMQVALGEAAIGICFSHDALKPTAQGYEVELSYPLEGTGTEVGGIALIKNGFEEEQENAKTFIDWFMSVRGQELFIDSESFRMPINASSSVTEGLVQLSDLATIDYDYVWASENKDSIIEKFADAVDGGENIAE